MPDATWEPDTASQLFHLLLVAYNGDDLEPFTVQNSADEPTIERHCFYYSMVMHPKVTFLFDNQGRGGMCDLTPHEIGAIWLTPDLLKHFGLSWDEVRNGAARTLGGTAPVPLVNLNVYTT